VDRARVPLHPLLVHFPLALWGMSFVFDVLSLRFGPTLVEAARYNLAAGVCAALIAAAAGAVDFFTRLPPSGVVRRIGRWHAALNTVGAALFTASLVLRWRVRGAPVTPPWPLSLSALAVVVVGISGYLGAVMVHNHGVGADGRGPDGRLTR
jgi:uncharacterized membrane protein